MSLLFVHSFVSSYCIEKQISSTIKRKPSEVQNLLRHQIFSRDMGWGKQRKCLEQKFHSRFYSSPFYMKCFIYYFHQHPPSPDASLLPRNRLTQFHQKRKPSSSNSVSLPFPGPASLHFLHSLALPNPVFSGFHPAPQQKLPLIQPLMGLSQDSLWPLFSPVPTWPLCCIRDYWPSPSFMKSLPGIKHTLSTLLVKCPHLLELVFLPFIPLKSCSFPNDSTWMHLGLKVEGSATCS